MKSEIQNNSIPIPIIDLFAGPGGLAEGFSSVIENGKRAFKIKLSIEKEENAHKTLELRSFCRQFPPNQLPPDYYEVLKETDLIRRKNKIKSLYQNHPEEYNHARKEAWKVELGSKDFPSEKVDQRITEALDGYKNWLLIGGPPCQAYSMAGRSRVGGIHKEDHRVYLYEQYLRIIATHQPAIFVMENVKGLLSAKLGKRSILNRILNDLKDPSKHFTDSKSAKYKVYSLVSSNVRVNKDYLIKSELYGIPQKRHRVILLGIREDLNIKSKDFNRLQIKDQVSLESVIGNLPKIRSGLNRKFISSSIINKKKKRIYQSLTDSPASWEKFINLFKNDVLTWNGLNKYADKSPITSPLINTGSEYLNVKSEFPINHPLKSWYSDSQLTGITHHHSRSHLVEDLLRYIFASIFTISEKRFPRLPDYERYSDYLMPDHDNAKSGKFNDRFRVQLPDIPATTVTSHISKDGHYFIHYDPSQCRSLTVREAARVQTFPDNYLFCGARTAQFHQVGNAVPPYLAYQISIIIYKLFKDL